MLFSAPAKIRRARFSLLGFASLTANLRRRSVVRAVVGWGESHEPQRSGAALGDVVPVQSLGFASLTANLRRRSMGRAVVRRG